MIWITNRSENDGPWTGHQAAFRGRPKPTGAYTAEELENMGIYGMYIPTDFKEKKDGLMDQTTKDDEQDGFVGPPHLEPELFDQIVAKLAAYNGAFDTSIGSMSINGVRFYRAPF